MGLIDSDMEEFKYQIEEDGRTGARFKVVGVGGGGCNAVCRMAQDGLDGIEYYALNTDLQALNACNISNKLQLGMRITNGLGAGSNPDIGRRAALENTDQIVELLQGADMVFVTAGLGGGTGTGAAPVIASLAKELDALVVAIVTKPFGFEGPRRMKVAEEGLERLTDNVDTVIAVPNDRILSIVPRGTSISEGFRMADDVLRQTVQAISDIIVTPGLINRDFADIKATMSGMGYAVMGTAVARGENAATEAARLALCSPMMEGSRITGSHSVLVNITGSSRLGLHDVTDACNVIREATACDVQINFGVILNETMEDSVKVTVIATGFQAEEVEEEPFFRVRDESQEQFQTIPQIDSEEEVVEIVAEPSMAETPEAEPAMMAAEADPILDMDDLDTPAYLRHGRMLN